MSLSRSDADHGRGHTDLVVFSTEVVPLGGLPPAASSLLDLSSEASDRSVLLEQLCAGLARAYGASASPDTRRTYAEGWSDYVAFAEVCGLPHLPIAGGDMRYLGTIALWAVWCCEQRPVLGHAPKGAERPVVRVGLAWSTVSTRLAGIVAGLAERGLPNPTRNVALRRVLEGLRRQYDREPVRATPLTTPRVRRLVDATYSASPRVLRDRALVVLVHAGVHQRGLERMRWEDLKVLEDRWIFDSAAGEICLLVQPEQAELCPLAALASWRAEGLGGVVAGPVFPLLGPDGHVRRVPTGVIRGSTHQALAKTVRYRATQAGVPVPTGAGLPDLSDPVATLAVLGAIEQADLIGVRDRALVLLGFVVASRRRNLAEFEVGDILVSELGMIVVFRRSKTDPYGTSPRKADVKRLDGGRYDPVAAIEAWLDVYAKALGRPLRPDDSLFPRINRHGRIAVTEASPTGPHASGEPDQHAVVPSRLSRAAVSEVTKTRAAKAGLVGRNSSHCMRRGLGSSLAKAKVPIQEIARRGGWKSLDTVAIYIEEASQFEDDIAGLLGLQELPES